VKAAGRFRTADQVLEATQAGATRISTRLTATLARLASDDTEPATARTAAAR
jgi:deoxyribose-phosphate aldolase